MPGPLTDEELLPPGLFEWVVAFGEKAISAFEPEAMGSFPGLAPRGLEVLGDDWMPNLN